MTISDSDRLRMLAPRPGLLRAVLDTDTYNEIDDQFALVQAMLAASASHHPHVAPEYGAPPLADATLRCRFLFRKNEIHARVFFELFSLPRSWSGGRGLLSSVWRTRLEESPGNGGAKA